MPYLVDGNNLMGIMAGRKVSESSARDQLIQQLGRYCRSKGNHVHIVFDGPPHEGRPKAMHLGRLRITFAGPELDADTTIRRAVEASRRVNELIVVSSDSRVYQHARSAGAKAMHCRDFQQDVENMLITADSMDGKTPMSDGDIADWMEFFGLEEEDQADE